MEAELVWVILLSIVALFVLFRTESRDSDKQIRTLYRQAARFAFASTQDESSVIKTLHANYAMGYLLALKDIATASEFKRATGDNLASFEYKITRIQDSSTVNLVSECEELIPDEDPMLLRAMYIKI
jgi:hypothetical protein